MKIKEGLKAVFLAEFTSSLWKVVDFADHFRVYRQLLSLLVKMCNYCTQNTHTHAHAHAHAHAHVHAHTHTHTHTHISLLRGNISLHLLVMLMFPYSSFKQLPSYRTFTSILHSYCSSKFPSCINDFLLFPFTLLSADYS